MLGFSLKQKHVGKHLRKESYGHLITFLFQIIIFIFTIKSFYLGFFFSSADILEKKPTKNFCSLRLSGRCNSAPAA